MKKIAILFFSLVFGLATYGQIQEPDYKHIRNEVDNYYSPYYYQKLMMRYLCNDTTLKTPHFHYLYYGYRFQEGYKANWRCSKEALIAGTLQKDTLMYTDWSYLKRQCMECLAENPVDIHWLGELSYISAVMGDTLELQPLQYKYKGLLKAIVASGTGRNSKEALHVISTSHEYEVLNALNLVPFGSAEMRRRYNYFSLEPNIFNIEGLYFNVEPGLKQQ